MTSCGYKYESADIVIEYQVPFAKSASHFNEIELVDKDDYGRKLYSYKSGNNYTNVFRDYMGIDYSNAPVLVYVIIQKTDRNFVYCYDDLCYTYVKSFEDDNNAIIDSLKEINDWGKPIDNKKSMALSIDVATNYITKYKVISVEEETVSTFEQMVGYKLEDYFLDTIFLEDATPIFVLREVTNREKHEFGKSYIFHIPEDDSNITYLELSDDIQNWNEEIHNFKITLQ